VLARWLLWLEFVFLGIFVFFARFAELLTGVVEIFFFRGQLKSEISRPF